MALVSFVVPHLSNVDVLPVTRKEIWGNMGIHPCVFVSPLRLLLSFTCTFTYLVIASFLVTLGKFT
jgi:hypothetical protein